MGRNFRSSSVPMLHDPSLLSYNAHYFSVTYKLNGNHESTDSYTMVTCHDEILLRRPPLDYKKVWLKKYLDIFLTVEKRPWFLINGDTNLLSRLKFTGSELKQLQGKEVAFYFYEPLFQRTNEDQRSPAFIHTDSKPFFPELGWVEDFIFNHGGTIRAKVYVCDYGLGTYLRSKNMYHSLQVQTWDFFLADLCRSLVEREIDRDAEFTKNGFPFNTLVSKKFICPNFRYEGVRELVVGFLEGQIQTRNQPANQKSSYSQSGSISFFHRHDPVHFRNELPFNPENLSWWHQIQDGIQGMQKKLPLVLDSKNSKVLDPQGFSLPDADGESNLRTGFEFYAWYSEAFLAVVNETRFGTLCGEISEKTFLPILYMRPFVVVGGPQMLRYLREMGFETFADLWDESYDEILNHGERMQAVLDLLDSLLSQPLADLQALLTKMQPRLARNRSRLLEGLLPDMHAFIQKENEQRNEKPL